MAIGITGLASSRRSRRDEEEEAAQRAAVDALFGRAPNDEDDNDDFCDGSRASFDPALFRDSWSHRGAAIAALTAPTQAVVYRHPGVLADSAARGERAAHCTTPRRPKPSPSVAVDRHSAARGRRSAPSPRRPARRGSVCKGVIWLAACLLLSGWVGWRDARPAVSGRGVAARRTSDVSAFASPTKPIEQIRVGQRVVAKTPDLVTAGRPGGTAVDPAMWRLLTLHAEQRWSDGTLDTIEIETLQPPDWIERHHASSGSSVPIPLDVAEMGISANMRAAVVQITPCPRIGDGPGQVVLTTINHLNHFLYELVLANDAGQRETVNPTGYHKFYSETRHDWTSASELRGGERLRGLDGMITLVSSRRLPGTQRVYNITIEGQHVYHVSALGAVVHNMNCGPWSNDPLPDDLGPFGDGELPSGGSGGPGSEADNAIMDALQTPPAVPDNPPLDLSPSMGGEESTWDGGIPPSQIGLSGTIGGEPGGPWAN